jgi:hypothetical protein
MAADSSCGKLETAGGFSKLVNEAVSETRRALSQLRKHKGGSATPLLAGANAGLGTVCVSAHSGGYHAAASAISHGGIAVSEVYLFDALYADVPAFAEWAKADSSPRRKLVSYVTGGAPRDNSHVLFNDLEKAGKRVYRETREGTLSRHELLEGDAILVESALGHGDVTRANNALRDCLFASRLPRRLHTEWFARLRGPRTIEPRAR